MIINRDEKNGAESVNAKNKLRLFVLNYYQ